MRKQLISDKELVSSYIDGNEQSLGKLVNRHKARVFSHIFFLVKSEALAQDIFQDTFIKVINTLRGGRYNEEGKFLPWVMRIAHNLVIDHFRKSNKFKIIDPKNPDFDIFDVIKSEDNNVEEDIILDQISSDVRELITHLPEDQNQIITLRHYREMSFKDISEELNISINTALGRMRYALINLRKLIEEKNIMLQVQ